MAKLTSLILSAFCLVASAAAHPSPDHAAEAHYLANEGIMVVDGDTKILFDPIFTHDYGQYELLPPDMKAALFAGAPPYDGIAAVFVSHAHGDHFDAAEMNRYMAGSGVFLVAPAQAVAQMRAAPGWDSAWLADRVAVIALDYGAAPQRVGPPAPIGDVRVEAVRIPHAGGPSRRGVENIVYRVTTPGGATVMHLGDASPEAQYYAPHADHFAARATDLAFVPYWVLGPTLGPEATREVLNAIALIGVHVPRTPPPPLVASGLDIFTTPGETRTITISAPAHEGDHP